MELGLVAYRTEIDQYIGEEYTYRKSSDYLSKSLDFLFDLLNESFATKEIDKFIVGSTFLKSVNRSYYIRRKISNHKISKKLKNSNVSYVDSACLTTFYAVDLLKNTDNDSINIFIGFEDLNIEPNEIKKVSLMSPDYELDAPWKISKKMHDKYEISSEDYSKYIRNSRNSIDKSKYSDAYQEFVYGNSKKSNLSSEKVSDIPIIEKQGYRLPFARLSRGATIVICTCDEDIVHELNGIVVKGIGCSSGIGNPAEIKPLLESIKKSLLDAKISISKVDFFEIFDSYLTATISLCKNIDVSVENINIYGSSLVRGDTTSAAGGLILCNTEAALKDHSDYSCGLLVQYSIPSVISIVVEEVS